METTEDIKYSHLADAWAQLQAHAAKGLPLEPDAYRLAFADPEFLLRRETRGLRIQLEMLKPDLDQTQAGVENTIVVFGSARFPAPDDAEARWRSLRPAATLWRSPRPSAACGIPATTNWRANLPGWWRPTACASRLANAFTSARAAAPASWKPPRAVPTTWAHPRWR
jgi:hypothetical protein